jgi:hypothetical protein
MFVCMQFKTTLLSRRFPGLKSLPDADIKEMILADRKAQGRKMQAPERTHPKTDFQPAPAPVQEAAKVFIPVNPAQAKEQAKRPDSEVGRGGALLEAPASPRMHATVGGVVSGGSPPVRSTASPGSSLHGLVCAYCRASST